MQNYITYIIMIVGLSNQYFTLIASDNRAPIKRKAHKISFNQSPEASSEEAEDKFDIHSPNNSSEEEYREGMSLQFSDDELIDFSVKYHKKTTKKNNFKKRSYLRPSQQKNAHLYYVCVKCAQLPNFLKSLKPGCFTGIYSSRNSYNNNSRVLHRDIYNKKQKDGPKMGAEWLKENRRCLELKNTTSLEDAVTKIIKQFEKGKNIEQVLKKFSAEKIAHEVRHELKKENAAIDPVVTAAGQFFDEDISISSSSDSDSSSSDSSDNDNA